MQARCFRLAVLIVAFAVAASACGKYSISNIRSAKAFQDANTMYNKQDYNGAIPRYMDAISFNPDLGFAYFFLGHSHEQLYKPARKDDPANQEHLRNAEKYYRTAVDKLKNTTDDKEKEVRRYAYEYLIAVYGADRLNAFPKAEQAARDLIAIDPTDSATYRILAKLYEDQGNFEAAEKELLNSINAKPSDTVGYQMLAGFYNRRGEFDKTMDAWNKRAAMEPKNPEAWHIIGSYYQQKVYQDKRLARNVALDMVLKGLENEDKALALNPDYYEAVLFKNILMKQQALYEKDPAKIKQLLADSDVLYKRAVDLKNKQAGGGK